MGRQERNITPVDLASNEIYDILRKRLFKSLPDTAERADIAASYGKKLEEASKSKVANRGAEAIADEVAATYPFHPRLKNVVALFKENGLCAGICKVLNWRAVEHFRQNEADERRRNRALGSDASAAPVIPCRRR